VGEQAIEDGLRAIAIRPTERLNEAVARKLTLVSALAGFGKTTLLSEWASHFGLATK
jgi:ATP/maltotriose-dependent transcriptional regulator MalT